MSKSKGYRTWLNVRADGLIESVVWCIGDPPADHPTPAPDPAHAAELRKNGGTNLYFHHGSAEVRPRLQLHWVASPLVAAVGETIKLHLAGLPDDFREPVDVFVGQDRVRLPHPYVLELGWRNPARVAVRLADAPEHVQATFTHVQFIERRQ